MDGTPASAERERVETFGKLEDGLREAGDWYHWGPYLSERQWGTVREDYSDGGTRGSTCRTTTPARARTAGARTASPASPTSSSGSASSLALWNGRDPILKERIFGLTGNQGNHGEDAKEYWWYLDALPSHAWNRWRYHYPQREYPYGDLVAENGRRGKLDPEYELLDTGAFDDDRYWIVEVDYAKADPHDLLMSISVTNAGPEADTLHVLPTAWYRNTWAWDEGDEKPELRADGDEHGSSPTIRSSGSLELVADGEPERALLRERDELRAALRPAAGVACPKDGINDHVVGGADDGRDRCAGRRPPSGTSSRSSRARRRPCACGCGRPAARPTRGPTSTRSSPGRQAEADEFYAELTPPRRIRRRGARHAPGPRRDALEQAALLLRGRPLARRRPDPADRRPRRGSAAATPRWRTFDAFDIMSMPDKWEYPWFAAWDLAFHCVALAHVDPAFAKYQLILLCREWFQHPNGALAAYEWSFDDVNPRSRRGLRSRYSRIDGGHDIDFLNRVFDKLLVNFTWWLNRQDADGSNLFEGGFLGLDNIGPIDRSHLAPGYRLEQSDGTGWMGFYALSMAAIATILNRTGRPARDLVAEVRRAVRAHLRRARDQTSGTRRTASSTTGWSARRVAAVGEGALDRRHPAAARGRRRSTRRSSTAREMVNKRAIELLAPAPRRDRRLEAGIVPPSSATAAAPRRRRLRAACSASCGALFDEDAFLSPYGLRAVSRYHAEHRSTIDIDGNRSTIDYEPAESTTGMFGGNSNWRGPIWFPVNYLVVERARALRALLRRRAHGRVPDGVRQAGKRSTAVGRRPPGPADLDLPRRRRRPAAVLRLGRAPPDRPRLEGQHRCSTSTSTATTAPASAPRTRQAGRGSSPT